MSDLKISRVVRRFGAAVALDEISLDVPQGELLAILGPSGCGKSTLLRIVAGLDDADAGDVAIGGRSMNGVPVHKRDIGLVFQSAALFPHRTVLENVAFGLKMRGVPRREREAKAREMLGVVELAALAGRLPKQLSGGQQQRVALARALIIQPRLLLLDEPLAALDMRLRQELRRQIRELQQALQMTAVFVTHDQVEALSMSDRLAVMNAGRVEQIGPPEGVYGRPTSEFVASFLGEANRVRGRVERIDAQHALVATDAGFSAQVENSSLREGERVLVIVRPDRLRIARRDMSRATARPAVGRVFIKSFLGGSVRYDIAMGDGVRVLVDASQVDSAAQFDVGDTVAVSCPSGNAFAFPDTA